MFQVNDRTKSGFSMQFENGLRVSVQWGPGTYSDNYDKIWMPDTTPTALTSNIAEVAVFKNGVFDVLRGDVDFVKGWPHCPEYDEVAGYLTPEQVAEVIAWCVAQPKG